MTEIFGDTTEYSVNREIEGVLRGLKGASPASNGTIISITAFLARASSDKSITISIKCAIYDEADDSLVAVTEERGIDDLASNGVWYTFNIVGNPSVSSANSYYLVAFAENTFENASLQVTTSAGSFEVVSDSASYPTWPDPIVPSIVDGSASIYCTYTPDVPAGVTRKIKIAGTFQDKPIKTKVGGTFVDKPIKIKVGGTFQDA